MLPRFWINLGGGGGGNVGYGDGGDDGNYVGLCSKGRRGLLNEFG